MRGPPHRGRHLAERVDELRFGRGDERRQVRGDAGLEQRVAGARVAVGVGAEEVDAGEAVHLQVDEAGRRDAAAVGDARPSPATRPSTISTSPGTSRPPTSAASTPSLTLRARAGCSARRGQPRPRRLRVDAGEQRDDRDLCVAAGRGERLLDLFAVAPVASRTTRRTRACSFSFVA